MQVIPISGLQLGFSGTTILYNSWALLGLLSTFIILDLSIPFTVRLVDLIKNIIEDDEKEKEEE